VGLRVLVLALELVLGYADNDGVLELVVLELVLGWADNDNDGHDGCLGGVVGHLPALLCGGFLGLAS